MAKKPKPTPASDMRPIAFSYIRFSTPRQAQGGSLERQVEKAEQWCEKNGYALDATYKDLGVGAGHGRHAVEGNLARFLSLVKKGMIPQDAILIVENLDRLSRERLTKAAQRLFDVIEAGVEVVTLHNGKRYGKNSAFTDILLALHEFEVAFKENQKRAERVRDGMARRRRKIYDGLKMNGRWPSWIVFNEETGAFELVAEKVKIVHEIYDRFLKGRSLAGIARDFNQADPCVPPFREHENARQNRLRKKRSGWGNNMVKHILTTKAVLGEFQPTTIQWEGDKSVRKIAGPPIKDFFPPIIPPKSFNQVQVKLSEQSVGGGRRDTIRNLFGPLLRCGKCGAHASRYIREKGLAVIRCNDDSRGVTKCGAASIRYQDVELAILLAIRDHINTQDLLGETEERQRELVQAEETLREHLAEIRGSEEILDRLVGLFADGGEMADVALRKAKETEERLRKARADVEIDQRLVSRLRTAIQDSNERLGGLHVLLYEALGDLPNLDLRRRLAAELRWIIGEIRVDPWQQAVVVILAPSKRELRLSPVTGRFRMQDRSISVHTRIVFPEDVEMPASEIAEDLLGSNIIVERLAPGDHEIYDLPQAVLIGNEVVVTPPRFKPIGEPLNWDARKQSRQKPS